MESRKLPQAELMRVQHKTITHANEHVQKSAVYCLCVLLVLKC